MFIVAGVATIGNQEDHFAAVAPASLEHLPGGIECIIEVIVVLVSAGAVNRYADPGRLLFTIDHRSGSRGIRHRA